MTLKDRPLKKCHTDKRKMIDDIHKDILQNMNFQEKLDYYQNNGLLLNQYYSENHNESLKNNSEDAGILSYFTNEKEKTNKSPRSDKKTIINESKLLNGTPRDRRVRIIPRLCSKAKPIVECTIKRPTAKLRKPKAVRFK